MTKKRLLLISNSRNYNEAFLEHAEADIKDFLGREPITVLFFPFAAVRFSPDAYEDMARQRFEQMGYQLKSIHHSNNPLQAAEEAQAFAVAGGNSFAMLDKLYQLNLLEEIRKCVVEDGIPYIGWSAGANLACPTIMTTNDMPIISPPSFKALNLVPFQINPHFTDAQIPRHQGETRTDRILEYLEVHRQSCVIGLREGGKLRLENDTLVLSGSQTARIFLYNREPYDVTPGTSLDFLLQTSLPDYGGNPS